MQIFFFKDTFINVFQGVQSTMVAGKQTKEYALSYD